MRILQVVPGVDPEIFGGMELVCRLTSKALAKRGHEITVYTATIATGYSRKVQEIDKIDGVNVRYFKNASNLLAQKSNLYLPRGMFFTIGKEMRSFDVIHLHDFRNGLNVIVHHYAKRYGIPYVLAAYGSVPRRRKRTSKWLVDVAFGYRILQDATKVIAGNETEVNEYQEIGVKRDKIVLIPPAYAIEEFSQLPPLGHFRHRFNIKEKHIILFLGRIHRIKGIDFLVKAFHQLNEERDDAILAIVGPDSGYKSTLEGMINELGLSKKVLFTGFLGGEEKLSALVDATMLVQTSVSERGPGSPFEAVLCKTPIIVTKGTGCGEIVAEADAGYLVEYGNLNELVDTMRKVIDDPTEARQKALKGKEYIIAELSWQKRVEDYEKLYQSAIKPRAVK